MTRIDQDIVGDSADLLTTGEAASLLNASRQHIVDLCNSGDIPYVTVGTHRRVRRSHLEELRARTARMTRDQQRSLWLGHAVAGKLVANPEDVLATGRANLATMQERDHRGRARHWLDEWERLLAGPTAEILEALTSRSPRARDLRQNSPFAGVLSQEERQEVLATFTRSTSASSR
jgi:excisionase family DNA binding protein